VLSEQVLHLLHVHNLLLLKLCNLSEHVFKTVFRFVGLENAELKECKALFLVIQRVNIVHKLLLVLVSLVDQWSYEILHAFTNLGFEVKAVSLSILRVQLELLNGISNSFGEHQLDAVLADGFTAALQLGHGYSTNSANS